MTEPPHKKTKVLDWSENLYNSYGTDKPLPKNTLQFFFRIPSISTQIITDISSESQLLELQKQISNFYTVFHTFCRDASEKIEIPTTNQQFKKDLEKVSTETIKGIQEPNFIDMALQNKLLGSLFVEGSPIPIYKGYIRPALFGMFDHLQTDNLKTIIAKESLQQGKVNVELLLGVSGSGKTFKLYSKSINQNFYLLFAICTPIQLFNSEGNGIDLSAAFDFTEVTDPSYQLLLQRLQTYSFVTRHVFVQSEVQFFILARLLYLNYLIDNSEDLTPQRFLYYQVNGYLVKIEEVYIALLKRFDPSKFPPSFLLSVNSNLIDDIKEKTGRDIGFALDEINSTDKDVFKINFLSKTGNKLSSFTNFFIENIILLGQQNPNMRYFGISGSNFDFSQTQKYISDLFKDSNLNIFFGQVDSINSEAEIVSFFSKFINTSDEGFKKAIIDCGQLMLGRKRLLSNVIYNSSSTVTEAVKTVHEGICNALFLNLEAKCRQKNSDLFWRGICKLFHILCLSRHVTEVSATNLNITNSLEWIPIGLCSVKMLDGDEGKYHISLSNEVFVLDTLIKFLQNNFTEFMKEFVNYISQSPELVSSQAFGSIFDILIMAHLIGQQNIRVHQFTSRGFKYLNNNKCDLFKFDDTLAITHFGDPTSFGFVDFNSFLNAGIQLSKDIKNNPKQKHAELCNPICGKLVKPPNKSHQDYISFQYIGSKIVLFEISIKYSDNETIDDEELLKSIYQLRTDMYFGTMYNSNTGFSKAKQESEEGRLALELQTIPSLKLHIAFPHFPDLQDAKMVASSNTLPQTVKEIVIDELGCQTSKILSVDVLKWIQQRRQVKEELASKTSSSAPPKETKEQKKAKIQEIIRAMAQVEKEQKKQRNKARLLQFKKIVFNNNK